MQDNNIDRHFAGKFNIGEEEIIGELIYNKESGVTLLNLVKQLSDTPLGKSYGNLDIITGVLNSGTIVTLFHNRCTQNQTKSFHTQQLIYVAEYSIWSKRDATNVKYNKLECVLENALDWSGFLNILSAFNIVLLQEPSYDPPFSFCHLYVANGLLFFL